MIIQSFQSTVVSRVLPSLHAKKSFGIFLSRKANISLKVVYEISGFLKNSSQKLVSQPPCKEAKTNNSTFLKCIFFQTPRPIAMKKEVIQTRNRKLNKKMMIKVKKVKKWVRFVTHICYVNLGIKNWSPSYADLRTVVDIPSRNVIVWRIKHRFSNAHIGYPDQLCFHIQVLTSKHILDRLSNYFWIFGLIYKKSASILSGHLK